MAYHVTDWTKAPPPWDEVGPKMVLEMRRHIGRSPHGIANLADPYERPIRPVVPILIAAQPIAGEKITIPYPNERGEPSKG